ncbi:MAG: hypothetical protein A2360_02245 [Candidatus Staskawiczbacteria bacterium RIFOXYB1_FULL_32_11]|uniref:PKD domain-containing protein n=1 Tax=Candidatus Staskawiczbacteria bacterium RIFOXYD1_FULL_32_13 TaxID=1802234 RepID=A0A1G2JNA2_9BACT|nr:MAG: hypothetical protein A2256_04310 [Candidatus Staskawiczbacteria bacterium RIFOXYA2_FULL_32_7]OGZ80995.1 MAG: hypothetical protein A2360_02245 [Candidatus Staskawiczbacteria bacterium RIFOXYB1_FULL_32_11]OGZ85166.1 MAG: hypothetical protein A2463_00620 [Candidatus Staskawiczbacteria bacterium RIFOXYC2_FULL_32_10]OGZ88589.1 MAG: hypothetical protein A2561_05130 [Candidatus Staskawiczbacteria bacterium RIFOXYD1_FULL_32_13]
MKIRYFVVLAVLLTVFFGFANNTKALSVQELQTQIQALMTQIAQLQAQLKQQQNQGTGAWCYNFTKNLRIGDIGTGDVDSLRKILQKEGILSSDVNPYEDDFSEQLASVVSEFQEKYADEILKPSGLKRGTGYVGPATRKKLNALYGCSVACTMDAKQCSDGSYVSRTGPKCEFAKCPETITVREQVKCIFNNSITEQKCYSADSGGSRFSCSGINTCVMDVFGAKGEKIEWKSSCGGLTSTKIDGENEYANFNCSTISQCRVDSDCPQIYCFTTPCPVNKCIEGKCISSSTTNKPPVISGVSGPTTLNVGQTGTWTITASDPENGILSYSVNWGDISTSPSVSISARTQTTTFTYTYYSVGVYKVGFDVYDNAGNATQSIITVNVGNSTATNCGKLIYFCSNDSPFCNYSTNLAVDNYAQNSGCVEVVKHILPKVLDLSTDSLALQYKVQAVPTFLFIDKNGCYDTILKASARTTENIIKDIANFQCPSAQPSITCTDSDGGENYFVKGVLNQKHGPLGINTDTCFTRTAGSTEARQLYSCIGGNNCYVYELYCNSTNDVNFKEINCPNGCENGLCK